MQSMQQFDSFFGEPMQMFRPSSLYFWDGFPHDFPFRPPMMMMPPPPRPMMMPQMMMRAPVPRTKIDHKETAEAHHFTAELPGLRTEDVDVHVEEGKMLSISAQKKHGREENSENHYHVERGCGAFMTKFMLPPNCKPQHMRSCVENGRLTVTVPKDNIDCANNQRIPTNNHY